MKFEELSKEAQETIKGIVENALEQGIGLGVDEGYRKDGKPRYWRKEIESWLGIKPTKHQGFIDIENLFRRK